ncbi:MULTISPECIES: hypothetical protein [Nguyenibacter]|uniref:Uncharacterized protein n=1 Tax=Nguyenibacter vanlangensis TaxID=1216886 RepID=A0ABZ3D0X8_9PROT|nr:MULTISPECIES: hypothetical protein [Nguyenibacter]WRH86623.1 hypothetical protein QN315_11375 [Nguyenibacter sp. L1]
MFIQEIGNLVASSMHFASFVQLVAFLPAVAALMLATAMSDRVA